MTEFQRWAVCVAMLCAALFMGACGDGEQDSEQPGCRLNSDCPIGEICVEARCVADEDTCEGDDCPCLQDSDCGAGQACDLERGECFALECLSDQGCPLGEVCLDGLCETDVEADRDRDGVPDAEDLCPEVENVDQEDADGDGAGDLCDDDDDNDAVPDAVDNCPRVSNSSQADANGDDIGNACDPEVQGTTVRGSIDFSVAGDPQTALAQVFITGRQEPAGIDAEGNFVFDQALPEGGTFTIRVLWPGFEIFSGTYRAPADVETFEVADIVMTLAPATMVGRARLQSQARHEDIQVQAFIGDTLVVDTRTDESGLYALAASEQDHRLRFSKPNHLPETLSVSWDRDDERFEVDGEPLDALDTVVLRPDLNATLTGSLSSPIANLPWSEVAVVRLEGGTSPLQEAVQSDGTFQFDQIQPGIYQLNVEAQGHQTGTSTVSVGAGANTLDTLALQLALGTPLSGAVQLEGRVDHSGVLVQANIEGTPVATTLTDADGAFELPTAALDHSLTFSLAAFEGASAAVIWNRDAERFEFNGEPTSDATLATLRAERSAQVVGNVQTPTGLPEIAQVRLIGEFETRLGTVAPGGDFQVNDVQPGFYILEVSAQGHLTETRVVSALSDQTVDVGRVALRLEVEIEEESVTLAGVARLSGRDRHAGILVEARVGQALIGSTLTNGEGAFALPAARLDYTVSFTADGFLAPPPLTVLWNDEETRFEVNGTALGQLDPAVTLQPDATAAITGSLTSPLGDIDWPSKAIVRVVGDHETRQAAPLGDGGFTVDGLQPGRYAVEVVVEAHQPISRDLTLASEQRADLGTMELSLALLETMRGTALLGGRDDHQGIAVEARIGEALIGSSVTDENGAFDILTARADHRLTFRKENYAPRTLDVTWNDDANRYEVEGSPLAQTPTTLTASRTASLTGTLSSPIEGLDFPNVAQLTLTGAEETRRGGALPDGGFSFDLLQPGFYVLEAVVDGHLSATRAVTLDDGATDLGTIEMVPEFEAPEEAVTMRGVATIQGQTDHLGIIVQAFVGGSPVGSAVTAEDGSWALTAARLDHTLRFSKDNHAAIDINVVWSDARERFETAGVALETFTGVTLQPSLTASLTGTLSSPIEGLDFPNVAQLTLTGEAVTRQGSALPDGGFSFLQLQPGFYVLEAVVDGHLTSTRAVTLNDGATDLGTIEMVPEFEAPEEAVTMRGVATIQGQTDHLGIIVQAFVGGSPVGSAVTAEDGSWALTAARLDHTLRFSKDNHAAVDINVVWSDARERFETAGVALETFTGVTLQPSLTASLTGTLSSPIEGLDFPNVAQLTLTGEAVTRQGSALPDGGFSFLQLQPGFYVLEAVVDGHLSATRAVTLDDGVTDLGTIEMVPEFEAPEEAVTMRGVATIQGQTDHLGIIVQAFVGGSPVGSAVTAEDGSWALTAARLDHALRFIKQDHTVATLDVVWSDARERFETAGVALETFTGVTLQPVRSAGLRGRLVSPVENLNFAEVNISIALVGDDGPAPPPTVNVDQFQFTQLQPGLYGLQIEVEGHVPRAEVVRLDADQTLDLGDISLSEEAQEPEAAVSMVGRARLSDARTPDRVLVRLLQNGVPVGTTVTDDQGEFGFQASRVDYRLEFTREGYGPAPVVVDVIWNRTNERFEVAGQPLASFTGIVLQRLTGRLTVSVDVAPDWIPAAQRTTSLRVVGEGQELSEAAVADGAATVFDGLDSGTYVVYAERKGFSLDQALVTIDAENETPSINLQVTLADLAGAGLDLRGVRVTSNDLAGISLLGANLSGADLSGQTLRNLDMTGVNLTNANLAGTDFGCTRLDEANLFGANLNNARLNNASLRFATLSSANLTSAIFTNFFANLTCDEGGPDPDVQDLYTGTLFSQSILANSQLQEVNLTGADLNYVTLSGADLEGATLLNVTMILANFTNAVMRDANFNGAVMLNAILVESDARNATFQGARLNSAIIENALFNGADLQNANFNGTTIVGAIFTGANASSGRFLGVTFDGNPENPDELHQVNFNNASMVGTLFNDIDLSEADFSGADLRSTTFVSVDFDKSAFTFANLTGASLIGADLRGVDFTFSDLSFANLARALTARSNIDHVVWNGTTCPDLSNSDDGGNTCLGHLYAGSECVIEPNTSCPNADLAHADLRGANLEGADLEATIFSNADVRYANFSKAKLGDQLGALFNGAALDGASFVDAKMVLVALADVTARGVNFGGADLRAAGFFNTSLTHCNLSGADLTSNTPAELVASFPNPIYDAQSVFPEGYDPAANQGTLLNDGEVFIPSLLFVMGSPGSEPGHRSDESPQHTVFITTPLAMMATEVTQAQWLALMGNNPSNPVEATLPMNAASWYDALAFANALSTSQGLPACYDLNACTGTPGVDFVCANDDLIDPNLDCEGWRLPTEAEWEGAARSGHTTAWFAGQISVPDGNDPVLNDVGWYDQNSGQLLQAVGRRDASPWGLFDMHGNAAEWVFDWENDDYRTRNFMLDPVFFQKPEFDPQRIVRGGDVFSPAQNTRSAFRNAFDAASRTHGIRLVRTLAFPP